MQAVCFTRLKPALRWSSSRRDRTRSQERRVWVPSRGWQGGTHLRGIGAIASLRERVTLVRRHDRILEEVLPAGSAAIRITTSSTSRRPGTALRDWSWWWIPASSSRARTRRGRSCSSRLLAEAGWRTSRALSGRWRDRFASSGARPSGRCAASTRRSWFDCDERARLHPDGSLAGDGADGLCSGG